MLIAVFCAFVDTFIRMPLAVLSLLAIVAGVILAIGVFLASLLWLAHRSAKKNTKDPRVTD